MCGLLCDLVAASPGLPSTAYLDAVVIVLRYNRHCRLLVGNDRSRFVKQRATLPQVSEREQTAAELSAQRVGRNLRSTNCGNASTPLNRRKNELVERRRTLNGLVRQLPLVAAELRRWDGILKGVEPNSDLRSLEAKEAKTQEDIVATRGQLNDVIAQQAKRATLFEARFNSVVQKTINNRFEGVVVIEEDGIEFRIKREKISFR